MTVIFFNFLPSSLGVVIKLREGVTRVHPYKAVSATEVSPHNERVVFARLLPLRFDVTAHCHKVLHTMLGGGGGRSSKNV